MRTSSLRDRMQNSEMDGTYALPDGRVVIARVIVPLGGDAPELGPMWELEIQGFDGAVIVGHPVQSALAELLGYNVAQEEWPRWIGDVALRIEADAAERRGTLTNTRPGYGSAAGSVVSDQTYGVVVVTATNPRRSRIGRLSLEASTSM